jgi:exo-1,4-beta-D-glucosaminidase
VQYAYDDRAVAVVNSTLQAFEGMRVAARVFDLNGQEKLRQTETVNVVPDGTLKVFQLPEPDNLTPTYFVVLTLEDPNGGVVSRNVYWLSTTAETLAWDDTEWHYTQVKRYADMTALNSLPAAQVKATARFAVSDEEGRARVTLENRSEAMAFFVHASVRKGQDGEEILPVLWEDNYVTLAPGESLDLGATYAAGDLGSAVPAVRVEGWNVARGWAETSP